jgi:hypothetical protein
VLATRRRVRPALPRSTPGRILFAATAAVLLAYQVYERYDRVLRALAKRDLAAAVAFNIGTAPGQSDWAFNRYGTALSSAISINQNAFSAAVQAGPARRVPLHPSGHYDRCTRYIGYICQQVAAAVPLNGTFGWQRVHPKAPSGGNGSRGVRHGVPVRSLPARYVPRAGFAAGQVSPG